MSTHELPDDLRLSEEQVRAIVERALREPPASTLITLAQLREIATELDIDQSALTTAAHEVLGGAQSDAVDIGVAESVLRKASRGNLGRGVLLGIFATALGILTTYVEAGALDGVLGRTTLPGSGAFIDVPVGAFLIALTLVNAYSRLRAGKRTQFLLESATTWLGFAVGWTLGDGRLTADLATFVGLALAGSFLLAWNQIHKRAKRIRSALAELLSRRTADDSASGDQVHESSADAFIETRGVRAGIAV